MQNVSTNSNSPLRIDSIKLPGNRGSIGMTFCPGKFDCGISSVSWQRDLKTDIEAIANWKADAVVTLLEEFELTLLGVPALPAMLLNRGIEWIHLPIRDVGVPDSQFEERWQESWQRLKSILSSGGNILLHCRGGIGRTGTIAARLLVEFGFKPSDAISLIQITRPGAIGTAAQEQYVLKLKKWPMRTIQKGSTPNNKQKIKSSFRWLSCQRSY
jgi:ADP-ribosyl-[dinitrogen reductase] hydrolase